MQRPPYALRPDRHPLARALRTHLAQSDLIAEGSRVVVALSGGLDSVVLLHLLRHGRVRKNIECVAAHFDHAMRVGSDADARWVRGLCTAWGVPAQLARATEPLRGEAAARAARYRFLIECGRNVGARAVLTAHHADDQAETVLIRLVRGTDLRGLAGIRARRSIVVRPLLPFGRAQLVEYAAAVGLRYRDDPTNVDVTIVRNRIRHDILPRLEAMRPGVALRIARIAEAAAADESAWAHTIAPLEEAAIVQRDARAIQLARPVLLSYHPRVRARVLRNVLQRMGGAPDRSGTRAALEFIRSGAGREIELAGGLRIAREFDRLIIRRTASVPEDRPLRIPGPADGSGEFVVGGCRFVVDWTVNARHDGSAAAFDLAALCFPLELRAWTPGDRIRLDYGSKKLKKLFVERRVPRGSRAEIPVLADVAGRIVWVMGIARATAAEPRAGQPTLCLAVSHAEPA